MTNTTAGMTSPAILDVDAHDAEQDAAVGVIVDALVEATREAEDHATDSRLASAVLSVTVLLAIRRVHDAVEHRPTHDTRKEWLTAAGSALGQLPRLQRLSHGTQFDDRETLAHEVRSRLREHNTEVARCATDHRVSCETLHALGMDLFGAIDCLDAESAHIRRLALSRVRDAVVTVAVTTTLASANLASRGSARGDGLPVPDRIFRSTAAIEADLYQRIERCAVEHPLEALARALAIRVPAVAFTEVANTDDDERRNRALTAIRAGFALVAEALVEVMRGLPDPDTWSDAPAPVGSGAARLLHNTMIVNAPQRFDLAGAWVHQLEGLARAVSPCRRAVRGDPDGPAAAREILTQRLRRSVAAIWVLDRLLEPLP